MQALPADERLRLWSVGRALPEALMEFGNSADIQAIKRIGPYTSLKLLMDGFSEQLRGQTTDKVNRGTALHTEYWNHHRALCSQVTQKLLAGELLSLGYSLPRTPEDHPTIVPADVFTGTVDWHKSTAKGNGLQFVAIRVLRNETKSKKPLVLVHPKRPGRPSLEVEILQAWNALQAEEAIPADVSLAALFPMVRQKIWSLHPELKNSEKGMGDQVLYKLLSPLHRGR